MIIFQLLGIALAALFALLIVLAVARGKLSRGAGLAWLLLWIGAGTAIARPEWTAVAARTVGITRGADLIFYTAILAALVSFFAVYLRLRRLESNITRIVRHLALHEPDGPSDDGPEG